MPSIAYLMRESCLGYEEIMNLPYSVFLGSLKQFQLMELNSTQEGRELLRKSEMLKQTEPDLASIRQLSGYKKR